MEAQNQFSDIRSMKLMHFHQRLMERFALVMTQEEIKKLIEDIDGYNPPPLRIEEDGKSFHLVDIQGMDIIILFDWQYLVPLTCYHFSWLSKNELGEWEPVKRYKSKNRRKYNKIITLKNQGKLLFYKN